MYREMSAPDLIGTCGVDAQKWAAAFCEMYPAVPQDIAEGWFANAMMTMWDVSNARATHDDTALLDHIGALVRNRDFWRELGADARITPSPAESSANSPNEVSASALATDEQLLPTIQSNGNKSP